MEAASNRHVPGLFLFYSLASGTTSYLALQHVQPDVVLLLDCTFWLGVVASVSLMEAWVKFRAPLLDRHVGVDAGRRVFMGQFAVESALALTACALEWAKGRDSLPALLLEPGDWALAGAGAILLVELLYLFPALNLRGKHLIVASARAETLSPRQQQYVAELKRALAGTANPPAQVHVASVALAFAKAGLLATAVWQLLLKLA